MISASEYRQVALEAAAPDGFEPIALSQDEMRAMLDKLGIAATSKLGRHALGGGRLWTRDGRAYQVATTAAGSIAANAASNGPSSEENLSPRVVQIGSMIVTLHRPPTAQSQLQTLTEPSVPPRFCIRMC
jgi:hypothetical protein